MLNPLFGISFFAKKTIVNIMKYQFCVILFIATLITILFSEIDFNGKQHTGINIDNLIENIYFSSVTLSTIGYGDISPKSKQARLFMTMVFFYIAVSLYCI